ncbi:MAG: 5'-deoxynucleotidase [Gemmatimonadetes bacterium]|jgi:5'-deoxynucleotidase|nr:5'-deoxynucleotidase [Gemmatimonadota bacterium]
MSHFFAYLSKMKFITRWSLMRNTWHENLQEHSLQVATIAHALAVVRNRFYNGQLNPERVALLALYHDAGEVIVGDLPTPIKYFNPTIRQAYGELEKDARQRLLGMLPEELRPDFASLFSPAEEDHQHAAVIAAADKICAYIKCLEERRAGNLEFSEAEKSIRAAIDAFDAPEVAYFVEHFIDSFSLTLDELN